MSEAVESAIETLIEEVAEEKEVAQENAKAIIEATQEMEHIRRVGDLERRMDEWQDQMSDTAQAIAALSLGMTELSGQMSALLTLQQPVTLPPPSEKEAGPLESQEEEALPVEVVIAEAETPEPPPPSVPKKKRHRWI